MPELQFENVPGAWSGQDYTSVSVTRVKWIGNSDALALVFMTNMSVDFDGAPTAYGPAGLQPLDSLEDAGRATGYYGLVAVDPNHIPHSDPPLIIDRRYPDAHGKVPVVQASDEPAPGYFVSTTAKKNPQGDASIYRQTHYRDSSAIPFFALSYGLTTLGAGDNDFGMAIHHRTGGQAAFAMMLGEGHAKGSGAHLEHRVGECSYKVFLDLGGTPKTVHQKYVDNNFPTSFIAFPGSDSSRLAEISSADNSDDFPMLLALYEQAGGIPPLGHSGLPALNNWVAGGRTGTRPKTYSNVINALQAQGF